MDCNAHTFWTGTMVALALVLLTCYPGEVLAQDTLAIESDTLEQGAAQVSDNVQYVVGSQRAAPAGLVRVRERIRQIRGEPQPQQQQAAQSQMPPIIIVMPAQADAAGDGVAEARPQTILIPGADGTYRPLGGLGAYTLDDDPGWRVTLREWSQLVLDDLVDPDEAPEDEEVLLDEIEEVEEVEEMEEPDLPHPSLIDLYPPELDLEEIEDEPVMDDERAQEELPEIATEPTVREVERAILETGLFRGLGVNFEFDRTDFLPEASRTLDAVGDVLQRYEDLQLEIAGHTDNIGRADYNRELSQRRAEAVVDYLVEEFGIDRNRLEPRGYGADEPFTANATPEGRALNRRVEFRLLNDEAREQLRDEIPQLDEERLRELLREVVREELDRRRNSDL